MPPPPGRLLVAVATYNEIENVPSLVAEILAVIPTADILIVDDDSPDGTGAWCEKRSADEPRLSCLRRTGQRGLGSATLAAFRHAIDRDYDLLITMDADFSHSPQALPSLVAAARDADVAIGSRYVEGGLIEGWPRTRRVASRLVNAASGLLAGLSPRDSSGAFRCYRVAALRRIDLGAIRARGFGYLEETLWHLQRANAKMVEVPITFCERRAGTSKINLGEACGKLKTIFRLAVQRWQ
jgi:dolichol-phosphate mannosyltransferase